MSIVAPIPITKLSTVYHPWDTAPRGALLAFGGECRRGNAREVKDTQAQQIVVRADGEDGVKAMVSVMPEVSLIMQAPEQGGLGSVVITFAFPQPAIDISAEYELAVSGLAPADVGSSLQAGEVVRNGRGEVFAFVGAIRRERFISLTGPEPFLLCDRPDGHLVALGKLSATRKGLA